MNGRLGFRDETFWKTCSVTSCDLFPFLSLLWSSQGQTEGGFLLVVNSVRLLLDFVE